MASKAEFHEFWHTNLTSLPKLTNSFIEKYTSANISTKASLTRGYKFFHESFIHDVKVKLTKQNEGPTVRAKCYRSMKKSEEPHTLLVVYEESKKDPGISSRRCSCAAGQGLCHHIIGLMYTLAHYQMLGLKSVPPLVSQTSKSQTWHIPNRIDGVKPRPLNDVIIQKIKDPTKENEQPNKKKRISGVTSTVYKPFDCNSINLPRALSPIFEGFNPRPGFLRVWPDENENIPLVNSKYGLVPKGSVLSYQQPLPKQKSSVLIINPNLTVPDFDLPQLRYPPFVLPEKQLLHFLSLAVTEEQAKDYEAQTRDQSLCLDWHRLRKHRITASKFKDVCSRQKDHEKLSERLIHGKMIKTAAMRYGIEHEDEAAQEYANRFSRDLSTVGFVINPSVPHLGCSPDRRVHDSSEPHPWGLLEIKCTMAELADLKYLKNENGIYMLRKTHSYFYQVMGCLGITGTTWADFYVHCRGGQYHSERIYFSKYFFSQMLENLNLFYFNFHLPSSV